MGVDEWSEKRIRDRINSLEEARRRIESADPLGAYPACARIESRLDGLNERLNERLNARPGAARTAPPR